MGKRSRWFQVGTDLRNHPKLISSAKSLEMPRVYVAAHLQNMWSSCIDFAEDGDLWRGDEESSLRFFESMADIPAYPERYIEVFRKDRWLDGWLVHDWLDYQNKLLMARHSSHNREFLVQTWRKHGREYGREHGPAIITPSPQGKLWGSDWEVVGNNKGTVGDNSDPPLTLSPNSNPYQEQKARSPCAPEKQNEKSPMGGSGGIVAPPGGGVVVETTAKTGSFYSVIQGERVPGCAYTQAELTGDGLPHKVVFEAFMKLLVVHSILTLESFYERVKRCNVSPAAWMMLFLDKVHAVYRDRDGTTLWESEEADPVGMTMAGLIPNKARPRHRHTEAARLLFLEVMMDYLKSQEGGTPKWQCRISGPAIAFELGRRKGKAGKVAS